MAMAPRYTILFVEDEAALRELVVQILTPLGFEVLVAADGYEAIRFLVERPVDLLFTDIVMPGLNGFDLAAQAKLLRPDLKVLYATGYAVQERRQAIRHGKLLRKPLRADQLAAEVNLALAG